MRNFHGVEKLSYNGLSILMLLSGVSLAPEAASAAGFIRMESAGFLKQAQDRGNSSSTLVLGPELKGDGRVISGELDLQAITFLSDKSSFTVEAENAYVATSPELMSRHQISLGRRRYDWSESDDSWKTGLWSPRFNWDPIRPQQVGLTGAFYRYQTSNWRVLGFASPVSVPERGYPIREQDGKLTSASPDWVPMMESVQIKDFARPVPIQYSLQYPELKELVMNPGAAVSLRYGRERGFWLNGVYGVLPVHQVDMAVEQSFYLDQKAVKATVHPRILTHEVLTLESGYRGSNLQGWASASGEYPLEKAISQGQAANRIGPALLMSGGGSVQLAGGFEILGSYLQIHEKKPAPKPGDLPIELPSRFQYTQAMKLGAQWTGMTHLTYGFNWTADLKDKSHLFSADIAFNKSGWQLGIGSDFFASATNRGPIGQYLGNDRVRGRIAYAF